MRQPLPTWPGRRPLLAGLAGAAAMALAPRAALALQPTPAQATGPFYPVDWSDDADADLVRVRGEAAQAEGIVTHLRGRVLDAQGAPVPGALIEIWQCDARGVYRHPRERQGGRDPGFQGRGRVIAGPDGRYAFRTIRPVPYPGRTPHIHAAILAPGRAPLVTQFYLAGEEGNARDGLFRRLSPRGQAAVLLHLERADAVEPGALLAGRDIVLG